MPAAAPAPQPGPVVAPGPVAAPAPATSPAIATAPAPAPVALPPITLAQVQSADVIVAGIVNQIQGKPDGSYFRLGTRRMSTGGFLKGSRLWIGRGFFIPAGQPVPFAQRDEVIVFARYDPVQNVNVVLPGVDAYRPADPQVIAQIQDMVAKQPRVAISMTTDKMTYGCGEPVKLMWKLTNATQQPINIYTGPFATGWGYALEGRVHSTGIGGTQSRSEADYRTLAPGGAWETSHTLTEMFPEGELRLNMAYLCDNNWIGSGETHIVSRKDNVFLDDDSREMVVTIQPPDAATIAKLTAALAGPVWEDQLNAMTILSGTHDGAALPAVQAMASHPSPLVRILAAKALTLAGAPMSPQLRDLVFDPDSQVRNATWPLVSRRQIANASIDILALKLVMSEAIDKGIAPATDKPGLWLYDGALIHLRDPRIGDLLVQLMAKGSDGGYVLNMLAGTNRQIHLNNSTPATDDQKAIILQAWTEQAKNVQNPYTMDQLNAEMDYCRAHAFNNMQVDPNIIAIGALMQKLNRNWANSGDDGKTLEAMGKGIVPTTLLLLRNNYEGYDSAALYNAYADWGATETVGDLLARSYKGEIFAPLAALHLNKAVAYPQLERLYTHNVGAALALASLGEKRAVPFIARRATENGVAWSEQASQALTLCTGLTKKAWEWEKWWQQEGSLQEWK